MTLILQLPDSQEAALKAKAEERGVSAEQYAEQLINRDLGEAVSTAEEPKAERHISEIIRERMSKIPKEVWDTLPTDGASEHDHYIYGWPKKHS